MVPRRPLAALACALLLAFSARAMAAPVVAGEAEQSIALGGASLPVFTYRPTGCVPRLLLLVFHGTNRNAAAYRAHARVLAQRSCAVLVAPEFSRAEFPRDRYQYGGTATEPAGRRTIDLMPALIAWSRQATNAPGLPIVLLGHSAGAQFLDRVAAFVPTGAASIIVANPSTWVLPRLDLAVPFGFAGSGPDPEAMLRAYLAAPITILLGRADTGSKNLAMSRAAMAQGPNRLARGQSAFRMAEQVARARGWAFGWTLAEVPGVGHDATAMFGSDEALAAVQRALRR